MAGACAAEEAKWWDVSYAPDGSDAEKTRFLRLHAAPEKLPQSGVHGTVVIIHGGYWKNKYGLDDAWGNAGTASLAPFFLSRGFAAVELEYRRRDHEGGGWPGTNEDILLALHRLTEIPPSDADSRRTRAVQALSPDRLLLVGHSAGGCLALWAGHQLAEDAPLEGPELAGAPASQPNTQLHTAGEGFVGACAPADGAAPGSGPLLQPSAAAAADVARRRRWQKGAKVQASIVLALSPVADLVRGHELHVSDEGDAVERYMGGPPSEALRADYAKASPAELLPVPFPLVVAFGSQDKDVPPELVRSYAQAAQESSPELVSVVEVPGADHFDVVNAGSAAWLEHIVPKLADVAKQELSEDAAQALLGV